MSTEQAPPRMSDYNGMSIVVLVSSRAVLPTHPDLTPATLVVSPETGKILAVHSTIIPQSSFPAGTTYHDHTPHVLLPGLVDAHVHLNEPGRTEWEGFWTGTRAAAFGGVTTVIDMPLNAIPPTTTLSGLRKKVEAAKGKCWVDVGFYGGIVPGNAGELAGLVEGGVKGFKGFLIDSGVAEFPAVSSSDIATAMRTLANIPTTLMFHAEMVPPITASTADDEQTSLAPLAPTGPLTHYQTFLNSRPPALEIYAVIEILRLASLAPNLHLHIVHLSAVECIPLLRQARRNGIKITAETCFHYLALAAEEVAMGDTRHKCCPPIRSRMNQQGLWEELMKSSSSAGEATAAENPKDSAIFDGEGVIRTVVSDHSPCTAGLKLLPDAIPGHDRHNISLPISTSSSSSSPPAEKGDFFTAWGGISSVGLGLPILWTQRAASKSPLFTLHDVVTWCAKNTAAQVGLSHRKGALAAGMDADVVVFDDEAEWEVRPSRMLFRNKCSPYEGKRLKGVVRETWVRGVRVFERAGMLEEIDNTSGSGFDEERGPMGELLLERRIV